MSARNHLDDSNEHSGLGSVFWEPRKPESLMENVVALPLLKVRPGTEADRAALIAMVGEVWRETYLGHLEYSLGSRQDAEHISQLVGNPAERGWVATHGNRLSGYCRVASNCVDQIWVPLRLRRRGVGSALLRQATEAIRERGFAFAQAGCEDFNPVARLFLEAHGWRMIGSESQRLTRGRSYEAQVFSRALG